MAEKLEVLEVQVPHLGYTEWHVVREGDYMPLAECDGEEWARLFAAAPELHDQLAAATARAEAAEARVAELEAENARLLAENYKQTKAATARAEKLLDRAEMAEALLAVLYRAAEDVAWDMPGSEFGLKRALVKVNVRAGVTRADAEAAYNYLAATKERDDD